MATKKTTAKKPATKKAAKKPVTPTKPRFVVCCEVVRDLRKATDRETLIAATNSAYVKDGGKDNLKESRQFTNYAVQAGVIFGSVEVDGDTVKPIRPSRKR